MFDEPVIDALLAHTAPAVIFEEPTTDTAGELFESTVSAQPVALSLDEPLMLTVLAVVPITMMQGEGEVTASAGVGTAPPVRARTATSINVLTIIKGKRAEVDDADNIFIYPYDTTYIECGIGLKVILWKGKGID